MWTRTVVLVSNLRARWKALQDEPEAGYASEAVLVTALLVIGAIIAISLLVAKVNSKANEIDLSLLMLSGVL